MAFLYEKCHMKRVHMCGSQMSIREPDFLIPINDQTKYKYILNIYKVAVSLY
jgi:hypothetical protein